MSEIDIEAANRLRVAMGLKPIAVPGAPSFKQANGEPEEEKASTVETRQAQAGDNWNKKLQEEEAKAKRKAQKEAIKKARDAAARDAKLVGKTLGEEDDEMDTGAWLRQQNKRRKKIENARRLEEELAAREKQAEYTAQDLAGVKVGHELGQFDAGEEQILTLKDAEIGEETEDDELENIDLRDKERLQSKLDLKKKKPVYNPNDDDDGEKGILSHYDEEINGKKQNKFTLDGFGSTREKAFEADEDANQNSKGIIVSLDFLQDNTPISDYVEPTEIKIRKPKKSKKSKSTRKKVDDDDDIFPINVATEEKSNTKKRTIDEANFVDDDDLQARLAQQRRDALKKKKRMRPEDLARQLREEEENKMNGLVESVEDEPGLVIDETSEFVAHLEQPEEREENKPLKVRSPSQANVETKREDSDDDIEMEDAACGERDERDPAAVKVEVPDEAVGLEEEATIEQGIGATLNMLRQRKHIAVDDSKSQLADKYRNHDHFISARRAREEDAEKKAKLQRDRERESGWWDKMSKREQEEYSHQQNVRREQQESLALARLYDKEYKPNIELKYIDEHGRSMNQKEAFKHLSHHFHGKGSGKQKHEKMLKKIELEKKREAMSTLDSSAHVSSAAMGNKAKKNQQAGVRLQ